MDKARQAVMKRGRSGVVLVSLLLALAVLVAPSSALATAPLSWSSPQLIDEASPTEGIGLTGISCASPSFCVAVDKEGNVLSSTNPTGGAAAWHRLNIDADRLLFSVSCPSAGFCAVIGVNEFGGGGVFTSTDPGGVGPWQSTGGVWADEAVSCPTSLFCAASGFGEISTSTNPTGGEGAWVEDTALGHLMLGISCPSAGFCAATELNPPGVWTSTNPTGGAAAWQETNLETSSISSISCPSRSFCAIGDVSNIIRVSTDPTGGAATWQLGGTDPEPSEGSGVTSIACPTASLCAGVDDIGDALESGDPTGGEAAWTLTPIDPSHRLTGISCPVASFCAAVDASGNLLTASGSPSPQHTLTISKTGSGSGTAYSAPFGIACGATCSHAFDYGTTVTLAAKPAEGSTFSGWSGGGCSGAGECEVPISADTQVTASFTASGGEPEEESGPSGGGSQGNPPAGQSPSPTPTPTPKPPPKKPLKCRKGFKKRRVHGKARCVKVRQHRHS